MTTADAITGAGKTASMPRQIGFTLTTTQVKKRWKTVTRRFGWWDLQPGTVLHGVEKTNDKMTRICSIRVISVRPEPLNALIDDPDYGRRECALEGFPDLPPEEYIALRVKHHGVIPDRICNRIYFEYLEDDHEKIQKH